MRPRLWADERAARRRARVGCRADGRRIFPRPGQDVLFFVDNIFRSPRRAPSLGAARRIPSAVGYQPTLATDMGTLQERITTTTKGSITSVQAIYVRPMI